ncbi:M28 family metallopeptidase [Xanthomonas translucens]|uniref:M28 family metallopeptidase n=1 Tax=Xanthomonas campestris pv. translucens TaxID=343 RepID=UPI0002A7AED1|nr:M28 family metallopeptidase [Xanthomonas translucens]AVY68284.1 peptidase M20 [Xanthomonas translucens pv. undulosa]ELQ07944.1 peptidase precursor [Xanthomonas translucens DAR61454]MBC3973469.1 M28 family peptidase [Xanthomonas translucens pv. undulosa]MCT8282099.1 M28 family metallopeptidase [Xanthomonas translucens pv. undulosa]MCT8316791.1 M28 family metallopeptidase [Xanthomonas translucens pv. undulosa]
MRMLLLSACLFMGGAAQAANEVLPGGGIDAEALERHVRTLASDAFEGRAPATPGEDKTIAYLSEQFRLAGVQPAGDDGGWTQAVPLVRAQVDGPVTATLRVAGAAQALVNGEDVVLQSLHPGSKVVLKDAPLVFVGYGIHAPERGWDDYKGVDLKGKIAVMLINDADFETPQPCAFDGRAVTYYGRWTYKYEEAARQGAAGVLIVHETAPAAYGWATVKSSGLSPLLDIERSDAQARAQHVPVHGWMQRALAVSLFQRAGLDFEAEKKRAQRADFRPQALGDAALSVRLALKRERVVTHNVVAKLEGATHPHETVIYSAHWDAFGIGAADASGDRIRRGAVDNATGVASVLELARVFAAGPRPQRTLYFLALTAEEKGLLGATYYAAHPLAPLATTVAVINSEMFSPDGATRDIASWGRGRVSLERDLAAAAQARGRAYAPDPNLEAGFFYRADHFAFARAGVPAITVGPGLDKLDGGVAAGKAIRDRYFAGCYHQPCDRWSASWDPAGHAADTLLLYDLGQRLADSREWPRWDDGSEFKPARDASEAARR